MKKIRFFPLILSALLLISCKETAISSDTPSSADGSDASAADSEVLPVEVRDFEGYEFTILSKEQEDYAPNEAWVESETGEILSDAIYRRNQAVESLLNIKIKSLALERNKMATDISTYILSGDETFDIGLVNYTTLQKLFGMENSILALSEIPTLDTSAAWWDAQSIETLSVNGKAYTVSGALNLHASMAIYGMFFNKAIISDYSMESPYDLVKSGKWTLDTMLDMMKQVTSDLNGDEKWDDNDRYGLIATQNGFRYLVYSCGEEQIVREGGILKINNSQRIHDAITKVLSVSTLHYEPTTYKNGNYEMQVFFSQNKALFYQSGLTGTMLLRSMDSDFGIIPGPKFDEKQSSYCSPVAGSFVSMTVVPFFNSDPERTGIITDALGWYSSQIVIPAFYDTMLTGKLTRDEDSLEMIQIMNDTKMYVINDVFNFADSATILTTIGKNGTNDYASRLAANESAIQTLLDAFNGAK